MKRGRATAPELLSDRHAQLRRRGRPFALTSDAYPRLCGSYPPPPAFPGLRKPRARQSPTEHHCGFLTLNARYDRFAVGNSQDETPPRHCAGGPLRWRATGLEGHWAGGPLGWTATGLEAVSPVALSPEPLRHAERFAYSSPDRLGVFAVRERLVDGPATQRGKDIVLGHALGIRIAELRSHPLPELRQSHPRQRKRGPTLTQRQGGQTGSTVHAGGCEIQPV